MGIFKRLLGGHGKIGRHGGGSGYGKHGSSKHGSYDQNQGGYSQPSGASCPNCNAMNASDARFCKQCGSSLLPPKCSQCNTMLPGNSKFCPQCGKEQG